LDRPITSHERDVILWLIDHATPEHEQLAAQVESLRVVSKCTCGCPTVYFAVEGDPPTRKGEEVISDYVATVDGHGVGVMLFELNGHLSSLEVYSFGVHKEPFGLPAIEDLRESGVAAALGAVLTEETLRKSAAGEEIHRANDADDLFDQLDIRF